MPWLLAYEQTLAVAHHPTLAIIFEFLKPVAISNHSSLEYGGWSWICV